MPRNGSGVYSLPPGSSFSPNTLAQSSVVNGINNDIAIDLNTPRPVVAGGTGGNTVATALANLGMSSYFQTLIGQGSGAALFATMGETHTFASAGYEKLPSGWMIQWGTETRTSDGQVVMPTTFPTVCVAVVATIKNPALSTTEMDSMVVNVTGTSTFTVAKRFFVSSVGVATQNSYWIAIGY
jgi:hypothetical protein